MKGDIKMVNYLKISEFITKKLGRNISVKQLQELEKSQKMAIYDLEILVQNEQIDELEKKLDQLGLQS